MAFNNLDIAKFWEGKRRSEARRADGDLIVLENRAEEAASPVKTTVSGGSVVVTVQPPPAPSRPAPMGHPIVTPDTDLAAYQEIAEAVGFAPPDLVLQKFRTFMAKRDLPVFNLVAVIQYMDALAERENKTGYGWHWCPLREKDRRAYMMGRASWFDADWKHNRPARKWPASDFYAADKSPPYNKLVPAHALRKVALIEKDFGHNTAFFVTDYATQPHQQPDPFLMAVVADDTIHGRFIIDVWDEPGFGLEQRLK